MCPTECFIPPQEGGQGLIYSHGRTVCLQFLQCLFDGSTDFSWRAVNCIILCALGSFGLDKSLFLMDLTKLDLSKLLVLYQNLFKVWSHFRVKTENSYSLYWLLQEPLILGACLDMTTQCNFPGLSTTFRFPGFLLLGHLLTLTRPLFKHVEVTSFN